MTILRTAAQQALEALELALAPFPLDFIRCQKAAEALRAALAEDAMQRLTDVQQEIEAALQSAGTPQTDHKPEPVQPVALIQQLWDIIDDIDTYSDIAKADDKLYRSLVERKQKDRWKTGITTDGYTLNIPLQEAPPQRKPLTEEEIKDCEMQAMVNGALPFEQRVFFARAIERAHGICE